MGLIFIIINNCQITVMLNFTHGGHLCGKPGNVWKLESCRGMLGNLQKSGISQENVRKNLAWENCLLLTVYLAAPMFNTVAELSGFPGGWPPTGSGAVMLISLSYKLSVCLFT